MNCPSCNKFPSYELGEPEVELEVSEAVSTAVESDDDSKNNGSVHVNCEARIVLTTECCGDEVKESCFSMDDDVEVVKADDCVCDNWLDTLEAEDDGAEATDNTESTKAFTYKRGPLKGQTVQKPISPRYQKRFYGVTVPVAIMCGCKKQVGETTFVDRVQASGMDELC